MVSPIEHFRLLQRSGEVRPCRAEVPQFSQTQADEVLNPGDILAVELVGALGEGERPLKRLLRLGITVLTQSREACPDMPMRGLDGCFGLGVLPLRHQPVIPEGRRLSSGR
jgi:hypothetical protein